MGNRPSNENQLIEKKEDNEQGRIFSNDENLGDFGRMERYEDRNRSDARSPVSLLRNIDYNEIAMIREIVHVRRRRESLDPPPDLRNDNEVQTRKDNFNKTMAIVGAIIGAVGGAHYGALGSCAGLICGFLVGIILAKLI